MKNAKIDPFILAILLFIGIAYLFPQWARIDSPLPLGKINSIGISLVFFFYGLKLSKEKILEGLSNWRLHLLVQICTFIIFPVLVILLYPLAHYGHLEDWWMGFMFLAALPSTVSSSVVMVSMAKGNVVAAIFNASISGLLGILLTPLWMSLFLYEHNMDFNLSGVYGKLLFEILLPVLSGLVLHRYWGNWARSNTRALSLFDKSMILLIIYKSFAHSFDEGVFEDIGNLELLQVFVAVVLLFVLMLLVSLKLAQRFRLNIEDQITLQFCGTKKSLVHGSVFTKLLFPASMPLGIILLPLMLFHALQIFVISILAKKWAERGLDEKI